MRCKAGRTGGPADEDFELSRFYRLKPGELLVMMVVVVMGMRRRMRRSVGWRTFNRCSLLTSGSLSFFLAFPAKYFSHNFYKDRNQI